MALCLALFVAQARAAQFVEVTAEIESTWWPAQGGEDIELTVQHGDQP